MDNLGSLHTNLLFVSRVHVVITVSILLYQSVETHDLTCQPVVKVHWGVRVICQLLLPMANGQPGWPALYTTCQAGKTSRCLPNLHPMRLSVADFYIRAIWRPCHHEILCRGFPFPKIEVSKSLCLIYFRHCHFLLLLANGQMEQNIAHAAPLLKSFLEANTPHDTGLLCQSQADE